MSFYLGTDVVSVKSFFTGLMTGNIQIALQMVQKFQRDQHIQYVTQVLQETLHYVMKLEHCTIMVMMFKD